MEPPNKLFEIPTQYPTPITTTIYSINMYVLEIGQGVIHHACVIGSPMRISNLDFGSMDHGMPATHHPITELPLTRITNNTIIQSSDPTTVDLVRFTLSTIATTLPTTCTVYLTLVVVVVMDDLKRHRKKIQNNMGSGII